MFEQCPQFPLSSHQEVRSGDMGELESFQLLEIASPMHRLQGPGIVAGPAQPPWAPRRLLRAPPFQAQSKLRLSTHAPERREKISGPFAFAPRDPVQAGGP